MSYQKIEGLVYKFSQNGGIIDIRRSQTDENETDPWILPPSKKIQPLVITDPLPSSVKITLANLIYIENDSVPPQLLARLKKLAAFQNPEFYRAQAMRFSTYDKPRIIGCAEEFPRHLGLPRGCISEVLDLFNKLKIRAEIINECFSGEPIRIRFVGKLRPNQREAVRSLNKHDIGVLSATPAFGKTVVAAWMIAKRKVNTLVLVHRRQLMPLGRAAVGRLNLRHRTVGSVDQWLESLSIFLNRSTDKIGLIGAGKQKPTGIIDIAMLQTLFRKGEVKDLVANYGQVIVDECHHIAAFSFEQVMKQVKARYVLGLTAAPTRQDGHHPIIIMQCGPIRYRSSAKDAIEEQPFKHVVKLRYTDFQMPSEEPNPHISQIYAALAVDEKRNELIAQDILAALHRGSTPLLLTERTRHVEYFREKLAPHVQNLIVLKGGMGRKERQAAAEQVQMPDNGSRMIIATGRYIGEGFDDARLDTLFLAMPISWHGTLQQYVGRLHRNHDNNAMLSLAVSGFLAVSFVGFL